MLPSKTCRGTALDPRDFHAVTCNSEGGRSQFCDFVILFVFSNFFLFLGILIGEEDVNAISRNFKRDPGSFAGSHRGQDSLPASREFKREHGASQPLDQKTNDRPESVVINPSNFKTREFKRVDDEPEEGMSTSSFSYTCP